MAENRLSQPLPAEQRAALRLLVERAIFELVPVAGFQQAAAALPPRVSVTVTASPRLGVDATLDAAEQLVAQRHDVCPHLAARSIRDRSHLADIVARLRRDNIRKLFIVGGDREAVGEFRDGLTVLKALDAAGESFEHIGVPSYPEGHPRISDSVLLDDLRAKQRYAQATTTQMSFNPTAVTAWIARIRDAGVTMPIHLGVPGVLQLHKLTTIGARIGIADSTRYLLKNRALLGRLMSGRAFGPDAWLAEMAPAIADARANVTALHVFTMNQVAETVEWQRVMLEELAP